MTTNKAMQENPEGKGKRFEFEKPETQTGGGEPPSAPPRGVAIRIMIDGKPIQFHTNDLDIADDYESKTDRQKMESIGRYLKEQGINQHLMNHEITVQETGNWFVTTDAVFG